MVEEDMPPELVTVDDYCVPHAKSRLKSTGVGRAEWLEFQLEEAADMAEIIAVQYGVLVALRALFLVSAHLRT